MACVPSTDFTKKTAEVGGIKVTKFNHRPQKSELEIVYEVSDDVVGAPTSSGAVAESTKTSAASTASSLVLPRVDYDNAEFVAEKLEKLYFEAFAKAGAATLPKEVLEPLRNQIHLVLATYKNAAYAAGFKAHISK